MNGWITYLVIPLGLVLVIAGIAFAVILQRSKHSATTAAEQKPDFTHLPAPELPPAAGLTLEEMLAQLAQCGIALTPPFTINDLLSCWSREQFTEDGYNLVLHTLAGTEQQEPWRQMCDCLYGFDIECVEDEGVYEEHLRDLAKLTHGDLELSDFDERVPEEGGTSRLRFKANGKPVKIDFEQDNDWFNDTVFISFMRLLADSGSQRRFFCLTECDQYLVIGCLLPEQIEQLNKLGVGLELY